MRRAALSLALMISFSGLWAQDFAPSQQAQGYLDSKNVSVDHATGLFHYRVPIYTLKSGDFELPISLNYVGKGVKIDDLPGLIGYNWNLNTGGIVTRTIRGGVADERYTGYIYQSYAFPPTTDEIDSVNKREKDGESDIFSAVFAGQTIHFIIKKNENNQIIAEPLEKTNVKIECEHSISGNSSYPIIDKWIITDENGHKYYFWQKEWSADILKEDAISFNGVRGATYVSSWHLNRIEPVNSVPVIYNYQTTVEPSGEQSGINEVRHFYGYNSVYYYGIPMERRTFDFTHYRANFDNYISRARAALMAEINITNIYENIHEIDSYGKISLNPNLDEIIDHLQYTNRILGILMTDYSDFQYATNEAVKSMNRLINATTNSRAKSYLMYAKYCIIDCLVAPPEKIHSQEVGAGGSMKIRSPLLDNITCGDKTVRFTYKKPWAGKDRHLSEISIEGGYGGSFLKVKLTTDEILSQVSYLGRDNVEFDRLCFDYYSKNSELQYLQDIWGFHRRNIFLPEDNAYYYIDSGVDGEDSKINSLSKIITPSGGEILIDYEPNEVTMQFGPKQGYHVDNFKVAVQYAGTRIKSLVLKEPVVGTTDTINYLYPYPGEMVFHESYNVDIVDYKGGFSDVVMHSRAKNLGHAFINTGNNGVFYDYVEEEFVGSGKKTYLFYTPCRISHHLGFYTFWLNGLPLGSAVYDQTGNLKSLKRYHYLCDVVDSYYGGKNNEDLKKIYSEPIWFTMNNIRTDYSKYLLQVRAYEYYMDRGEIEGAYSSQGDILLYSDSGGAGYYSPYAEYLANIEPRTHVKLPEQWWILHYGGKVLLLSQEEYRIESNYSSASSVDHYIASDLGEPFSRTKFFYDNISNSIAPTRIVTTDSKGDKYTSVIRRIVDMSTSQMESMKSRNILSPIVKKQTLKNSKLLSEIVNIYSLGTTSSPTLFNVTQVKSYVPSSKITVTSFPETDSRLFGYKETEYFTERQFSYGYNGGNYVPVNVTERDKVKSFCYDPVTNNIILEVNGYGRDYCSASQVVDSPLFDNIKPEVKEVHEAGLEVILLASSDNIIYYTVKHSGGTYTGSVTTPLKSQWAIRKFIIDLSNFKDITSVIINKTPSAYTPYIAVVPKNSEYQAAYYHSDGTVACRFDHNSNIEWYEYDGAGRVIKVFDGHGNLLKENSYNNAIM